MSEARSIPDITQVLQLRELGWSLIPCKTNKKPYLQSWKFAQAKPAEAEQLQEWRKVYRPLLWAVVAGRVSGIVILDFDGDQGLETLKQLGLKPHVLTGSGGVHVYFRHPGVDIPTVNAKSKKILAQHFPGLDVRSDGGYAACLGMNDSGAYVWKRSFKELEDWTQLPADLRELLERPAELSAAEPPRPAAPSAGLVAELMRRAVDRAQWEGRNNAGWWLAVQLRDNRLELPAAEAAMRDFVAGVPQLDQHGKRSAYTVAEAFSSLRQAYRREAREPWKQAPGGNGGVGGAGVGNGNGKGRASCAYTERGNAHRVLEADGENFRYVQEVRDFGWWDGTRWRLKASADVMGCIMSMAGRLYDEAAALEDEAARKRLLKWADTSNSYAHIRGVFGILRGLPEVQARLEDFDLSGAWFNCSNGTYDAWKGEFRGHERGDRISRCSPIVYDERAGCPRFVDFVFEVVGGDVELYAFLQRVLGYCLTGWVTEQCMFLLYGDGSNGKSTLLEVMSELWGEYACVTDFEVFLKHVYDFRLEEKIASLRGCYLAVAHEGRQGAVMATDVIKKVVGTSNLTGRFLFQNRFEFRPMHKLFLETNYRPEVHEVDDGFWRRIRPIPFSVSFEGREDRELGAKLREELPGILNWVIEGNRNWRRSGLGTARKIEAVRKDYRAESYLLGAFIAERCRQGSELKVRPMELFAEYSRWAEARREPVMTMTKFGRELKKRFSESRDKEGCWYKGLEVGDSDG